MLRVKDGGESEGRIVMIQIGIETLFHAKASRLPLGLYSRENLEKR